MTERTRNRAQATFATVLALVALVAACATQRAGPDTPDGFVPPNVTDASAPHTAVVQRSVDDDTEARLLRIAEATYPPRAVVEAAARGGFRDDADPSPDEPLWWHGSFDGVRLPYAITADAVAYYWNLHQRFEAGDANAAGPIAMDTTSFHYTATVEHQDTFELNGQRFDNVYVVRMRLRWHNWCGDLCALWIDKERTVVMRRDGRILAVDGDEPSSVIVS